MEIFNLMDKKQYIKEYAQLCLKEWGTFNDINEFNEKVDRKVNNILNKENKNIISVLVIEKDDEMLGFISLFKEDGEERTDLTPWYATMYVKKEFRGQGISKILNSAILEEARRLDYDRVYLKSYLVSYYEKFGAKYMEDLKNGERLYYIDL